MSKAKEPLPKPLFFKTPKALRLWFTRNAATAEQLHLGFYKVASGKASVTWPEAVDEALCVGWIDGVRHRIDEVSYRIRFTPRRKSSHWSDVNIRRVAVLIEEGRMQPAGLSAFQLRQESRSRKAAYEQTGAPEFSKDQLRQIRSSPVAWRFLQDLPPGYRKQVTWWVVSAKRSDTQDKRLQQLIESFARQQRL